MVKLKTANVGSYPRVGDSKEEQKLRRAISRFEQDEISEEQLTEIQHDVIRDVVGEQEDTGVDQVTDGQIRWYCPFSHMVRKMSGTDINGLVRYFDTNFYFRQPVVHEPPERDGSIVGDEFEVARDASSRTVRQVLTGPFTLARYSLTGDNGGAIPRRKLALQYAKAIAEEINDLADRGAETVQLDEHGLRDADGEEGERLLVDALQAVADDVDADVWLSTSFSYGSPPRALPLLEALPVDEVVLDLVYEDKTANRLPEVNPEQDLVLGVLNARNTKLEDPSEEADRLAPLVEKLDRDTLTLSPSTGLELLPRDRAQEKLSLLVDLKQELKNKL